MSDDTSDDIPKSVFLRRQNNLDDMQDHDMDAQRDSASHHDKETERDKEPQSSRKLMNLMKISGMDKGRVGKKKLRKLKLKKLEQG